MKFSAESVQATAQQLVTEDNCAILDNSPGDCQSKYGFPPTGVKAANPFKLELGKEPLSNGPGNAFTDGSNAVVTVAIDGYSPRTLTLAAWEDAGDATGTGTQATATGSAAGQTGGSSAATPTNAAGVIGSPDVRIAGGLAVLLFWGMW